MKIIRMRDGCRIHCSDSEFAALEKIYELGREDIVSMNSADLEQLPAAVKRGLGSLDRDHLHGLNITEDRRTA